MNSLFLVKFSTAQTILSELDATSFGTISSVIPAGPFVIISIISDYGINTAALNNFLKSFSKH